MRCSQHDGDSDRGVANSDVGSGVVQRRLGLSTIDPDQRIVSVGYAMMADTVPDGSITGAKLANNSITSAQISDGAINSAALAANSVNSTTSLTGR